MKTILILTLSALALVLCASCVSTRATRADATLIQPLLEKLLPADFTGAVDLSHANQYFTIAITAGSVRRLPSGQWTWDWLTYERKSHFPIFSGVTWSSTGKITLGTPPKP